MNQEQTIRLNEAYTAWRDALKNANASYDEFQSIQAVLNADPQKWSTTILQYNGSSFTRQDLQARCDQYYQLSLNQKKIADELKASYDKLSEDIQASNSAAAATAAATAQAAFNAANPEIALAIETTKTKAASVQLTTKYLIYGAIALVLVIGVILIVRKKYAA